MSFQECLPNANPVQLVLIDRAENALFEIDRQIAQLAPDLSRYAVLHDVVDAPATEDYFRKFQPQIIFHAAAHKTRANDGRPSWRCH